MALGRAGTVAALGTAQTLAWGSSYYLPAMLAVPMARDLGVSVSTVFAAFSAALIVSALLGAYAGRLIDQWGGRPVLMGTNLVFALGLVTLAWSSGPGWLVLAWLTLGVGMGSGLYEAAFAALVRLYGRDSRNMITGITLIAGFASTIGWPLSTFLEAHLGWRGACISWAVLHLVLGLPLNALLPRAQPLPAQAASVKSVDAADGSAGKATAIVLALIFAITWFVATAMAAHLPRLLQTTGLSLTAAVAVGALVGPAQVAGRLLEFGFLRRVHPLISARLASALHPIGVVILAVAGPAGATAFGVLHGAGNGILTIAKGTLPLVFFGPHGYGQRTGLISIPGRFAQALAPFVFGLFIDRWGAGALAISAALCMVAFAALWFLPKVAGHVERTAPV